MHFSVLLQESIDKLAINPEGVYIDATFGRGGHSRAILNKLTTGKLIAFDKDLDAVEYANENFKEYDNFKIMHASFTNIHSYCCSNGLLGSIDGVIMDLGVSSPQIDNAGRGFSFMNDGPLDMRMNVTSGKTAQQVLEDISKEDLTYVLRVYGEEKFAKKIANNIKHYIDNIGSITSTLQLSNLIRNTIGQREKKNPATRSFQALRIHVNAELEDLEILLGNILDVLKCGGRIAAISFHSLEDRIVKQIFTGYINPKQELNRITKMLPRETDNIKLKWVVKKMKASRNELDKNVRSRSAMLRVVEKL